LRDRIFGLDIGTSNVRLIVAEFEEARLINILAFGEAESIGISNGVVTDIPDAASAVHKAVLSADLPAGVKASSVIVGVSGQQVASLNASAVVAVTRTTRRIATEDVAKALEQAKIIVLPPDRAILHCIPRLFRVDGQPGVRRPIGMFGNRLEIDAHIVTSTYASAQNTSATLSTARLELRESLLTSIASADAVLATDERNLGVVLVDVGSGATDIAVFVEGAIAYSAVIPLGGNQVTTDISAALRISWGDAEKLKRSYGSLSDDRAEPGMTASMDIVELGVGEKKRITEQDVGRLIQPRLEELACLVRLELIKSGFYGVLPAGVVLSGGGAKLCGVSSLFERVLRMPMRVGAPIFDAVPISLRQPEYATVVGLALHAAANPPAPYAGYSNAFQDGLKQITSILRALRG
jgi:cell division protein FtsA